MGTRTETLFTGQIMSYNGMYGFIKFNNENIYFHRNSLKDDEYLCKEDTVTFRQRPSRKKKDKKEAYDIKFVSYGNFRKNYNSSVQVGDYNVQIGLIKWFDNEKGFGVILNLNHEEFFWRESSFMSASAQIGDVVIFIGNVAKGKKYAKKCRFPRYLEDWAYISALDDSNIEFVIQTYCKINPYVIGGMGYKGIKYNLKTAASEKILKELNPNSCDNTAILSDLILYHAAHRVCNNFSIVQFRKLYGPEEFNHLCISLFNIIKNYKDECGVKYLFDFIFVDRLIEYSSLEFDEKKELIDSQIKNRLIYIDERATNFKSQPSIRSNKFSIIKDISFALKDDIEMSSYIYKKIVPLLDAETIILLFFDAILDTYLDKRTISDEVVSKFLLSIGLKKLNLKWDAKVPYSGIDLKRRYFNNCFASNDIFNGSLSSNSSVFDILKLLLSSELIKEEVKLEFLPIILENSSSSSVNLILTDDDVNRYIISNIGDNKNVLDKIVSSKNEYFIKKLRNLSDTYSNERYILLLKSGLLSLPDYTTVFNLTRGLPITYLIDAFHLLHCNNQDNYWRFFESIYNVLSSEEKMYLWMEGLNNHYNYPELIQTSYLLTSEKRKLLNKKIKEYAKSERFNDFLSQIPNAEIESRYGDKIIYKCKWRNLYYKDGEIIVFINKSEALHTYKWFPAREEWNWLTNEYFNRKRIGDISVITINRHIVDIIGLEEIEEKIIIANIQKNGATNHKLKLSNEQLIRIIHNVAARNKCIDFLSRQVSQFDVIDVQELVSNQYGEIRRDISFMFIIPHDAYAYIIWESVEFEKSKATYVFRCNIDSALLYANKIKLYIENNIHVRSKLTSNSSYEQDRLSLKYFAKINHDSQKYDIWEARMKEVLPFMK